MGFVNGDFDLLNAAYIGSWLKVMKEDKWAIFSAAHAQRAAEFLHKLQPAPNQQ